MLEAMATVCSGLRPSRYSVYSAATSETAAVLADLREEISPAIDECGILAEGAAGEDINNRRSAASWAPSSAMENDPSSA